MSEIIVPHRDFRSFPRTTLNMFLEAVVMKKNMTLPRPGCSAVPSTSRWRGYPPAVLVLERNLLLEPNEAGGEWRSSAGWQSIPNGQSRNATRIILGADHRSALLDFNTRLPYTNIYSKKFFPRPEYIMEVLAKTRNHHQARPSVVSSPRVGMSAAKRTKTPSNKIET